MLRLAVWVKPIYPFKCRLMDMLEMVIKGCMVKKYENIHTFYIHT